MRKVFLVVFFSVFSVFSACSLGPLEESNEQQGAPPASPSVRTDRNALWVFTDEVQEAGARDALLRFAADEGVNVLYVSVYQPFENAQGRRMYDEDALAAFIRQAHAAGVEVWVAFGAKTWHQFGCRPGTPPYQRMLEVLAFNREHPETPFDGMMLDLEPDEPADLEALLALYDEILAVVRPAGLRVAGALRFFWDRSLAAADGKAAPAYRHFLDRDLDHVVVMSYRNFAGATCPDNGVICLIEDEMTYADARGLAGRVVVGLRTASVEADGDPAATTFFGLPPDVMLRERGRIETHFRRYASFGGFAMHQYRTEARWNP